MTIKISDVVVKHEGQVIQTEMSYHYFGSTAYHWCREDSAEAVLKTLARNAGSDNIKRQVKANGGLYAWVCKVEKPRTASYAINFFQPVDVPISHSAEYHIMNSKGHCLPITREKRDV